MTKISPKRFDERPPADGSEGRRDCWYQYVLSTVQPTDPKTPTFWMVVGIHLPSRRSRRNDSIERLSDVPDVEGFRSSVPSSLKKGNRKRKTTSLPVDADWLIRHGGNFEPRKRAGNQRPKPHATLLRSFFFNSDTFSVKRYRSGARWIGTTRRS